MGKIHLRTMVAKMNEKGRDKKNLGDSRLLEGTERSVSPRKEGKRDVGSKGQSEMSFCKKAS